jgi:hypothetical protein
MRTAKRGSAGGAQGIDPQRARQLAFLAHRLIDPDEEARSRAVGIVVQACRTGGLGEVAGVLAEVVCRGKKVSARQAAASLADIGSPARWPVTRRFLSTRSARQKLKLVAVLEALAPRLGEQACTDLLFLFAPLFFQTQDRALAGALQGLLGRLRARLDGGAGAVDAAGAAPVKA